MTVVTIAAAATSMQHPNCRGYQLTIFIHACCLARKSSPGVPVRRGKVRDVYDLGDRLLLVATDRISAFDWVMPTGIPDKGRILTQLSTFWFDLWRAEPSDLDRHRLRSTCRRAATRAELAGRSTIVKKCRVVPVECVVRGYLEGSGWKEYQPERHRLRHSRCRRGWCNARSCPSRSSRRPRRKKAATMRTFRSSRWRRLSAGSGRGAARREPRHLHCARPTMRSRGASSSPTRNSNWLGRQATRRRRADSDRRSADARQLALLAGRPYQPGRAQPSFDKQFVRDWLETTGWDKNSPPPALPEEVVAGTRAKIRGSLRALTGKPLL